MTLLGVVQADERIEGVLVIGNDKDWTDECQRMLQSLGFTSFTARSPAEALAGIDDRSISTLIIDQDIPGLGGVSLVEELAARTADEGRNPRFILVTDHMNPDMVPAAVRASVIDILQKPITRDNLRNALLRARDTQPENSSREALASQLTMLSLEIQRLSCLMDEALPSLGNGAPAVETTHPDEMVTSEFIRDQLRKEAKRRAILDGRLLGDCTWAVLLDLLAAELDGHEVSVSSACIASGAPTTTALRLINRLVTEKVLERIPDAQDGRRDFLRLSPDVETALLAYLADLRKN